MEIPSKLAQLVNARQLSTVEMYFTCADCPTDFEPVQGRPPETVLIRGGSMIVSPFEEMLAGPLEEREGLIEATIDIVHALVSAGVSVD